MKTLILCALMLCAAPLSGQALPDAPKPRFARVDWALLSADAAVRTLDTISTRRMLECPCNHEMFLPPSIANYTPALAAFEGGMVYAQYWIARKLIAHHHRKLAYAMTAADISSTAPFAIHNLFLPVCVAPSVYLSTGCQAPVSGVTYK